MSLTEGQVYNTNLQYLAGKLHRQISSPQNVPQDKTDNVHSGRCPFIWQAQLPQNSARNKADLNLQPITHKRHETKITTSTKVTTIIHANKDKYNPRATLNVTFSK